MTRRIAASAFSTLLLALVLVAPSALAQNLTPGLRLESDNVRSSSPEPDAGDEICDDEVTDGPVLTCFIGQVTQTLDDSATFWGKYCDNPTVSASDKMGNFVPLLILSSGPNHITVDLAGFTDPADVVFAIECPCETCECKVTIGAQGPTGPPGQDGATGPTGPPGSGATFTPSPTAAAPDLVRLEGTSVGADVINLQVVIDGPTTSTDLYAFAFDIHLSNPGVVQFIPGSAVFGDALETTGDQEGLVFVVQQGDRLIVGVSKTGAGSGNGVVGSGVPILSFDLAVNPGTTSLTFADSPAGKPPAAFDSNLNPIPSVIFDALSATISR